MVVLPESIRQSVNSSSALKLKARVEELVSTSDLCQRNRDIGPGYGHLPPHNDVSVPWEEITIDLIGPWAIEIPCIGELSISALTAIDTATGLAELVCIDNKTLAHIALKLEHMWLACYP